MFLKLKIISVALFLCVSPLPPSPPFAQTQYPALPSETPARLVPATDGFDYVKRDVMIPMRDGVRLHTVVIVPKGATGAPILLTRTPYDATVLTSHAQSAHLGPILSGYDNATDYLVASTSGTDSDWVVKLIDVYPDEVAGQPALGGYQLMVSADIFRGRYRESFDRPAAIAANTPLSYRFPLPTANHVFLPGHRIMVQVQSSWFPLYDRNPQTFVRNIFFAAPGDYRKAVQRIYHAGAQSSFVELPLVTTP
jgi:predicted acyl esterase